MKYLLILLLTLTSTLNAQTLVSESYLTPHIEQYVKEAHCRDLLIMERLVETVDTIKFNSNLKYPIIGRYDRIFKVVELSDYCKLDTLIVRRALYHELGHAVRQSGDHICGICDNINAAYHTQGFAKDTDTLYWNIQLDDYFREIKEYLRE